MYSDKSRRTSGLGFRHTPELNREPWQGGQGRSNKSLDDTARACGWMLIAVVALTWGCWLWSLLA